MGDLLIRNIPDDLRIALKAQASGRSLSEAAKELLQVGLRSADKESPKELNLWEAMQNFLGDDGATEAEDEVYKEILQEARHAGDREVPDFE